MNGIAIVQAQGVQQKKGEGGTQKSSTSFEKILNSTLSTNDQALPDSTLVKTKDGNENDIHFLLKEFVNHFPEMEQFIVEEFSMDANIEDLLSLLPTELQVEIENIIRSSQEVLILDNDVSDYLQSPAHLLVFMIKLSNFTSLETTTLKGKDTEPLIQRMLVQLETMLSDEPFNSANKSSFDKQQFVLSAYKAFSLTEPVQVNQAALPNIQGLPLSQLHQFVLHVGEGRAEQRNEDQFLRQFQNILDKSTLIQSPNGMNKLTIKLFPQHLGRLDVTLIQQNGMIVAQLLTTTKAAKQLVEAQIHHLKQAFVNQNIQVEKIDIQTQQSYLQDRQSQEEQRNSNQNKDKTSRETEDEDVKFEDLLKELNEIDTRV